VATDDIFAQTSLRLGMPAQPARNLASANAAVLHELASIRFEGNDVPVRLAVRQSEDGMWRGRVHFGAEDTEGERTTAEIFCAATEQDLWESVRDLRDHHLRDLYRSLI
jgi:hypothetical protein